MYIPVKGASGYVTSFLSSSDKLSDFKSKIILMKNLSFATSVDDVANSDSVATTRILHGEHEQVEW